MQLNTFCIPATDGDAVVDEVNRFLRSHRILKAEHQFCAESGGYWALMISYADSVAAEPAPAFQKDKKDVTLDMTDEERERYERFRKIRREISAQRGVSAFLVFSNSELAILAKVPSLNAETAKAVRGVNPKHMEDFVSFFFDPADGEASGKLDAAHSEP